MSKRNARFPISNYRYPSKLLLMTLVSVLFAQLCNDCRTVDFVLCCQNVPVTSRTWRQ